MRYIYTHKNQRKELSNDNIYTYTKLEDLLRDMYVVCLSEGLTSLAFMLLDWHYITYLCFQIHY